MSLLDGLVDEKKLAVLKVFASKPGQLFHINLVAKEAKVPVATVFRIIIDFRGLGLIDTIKISKMKLYRMSDSDRASKIRKLL